MPEAFYSAKPEGSSRSRRHTPLGIHSEAATPVFLGRLWERLSPVPVCHIDHSHALVIECS